MICPHDYNFLLIITPDVDFLYTLVLDHEIDDLLEFHQSTSGYDTYVVTEMDRLVNSEGPYFQGMIGLHGHAFAKSLEGDIYF